MRTPNRKPGKYSQVKLDPILTEKKFEELNNKLKRLKKIVQPQAAAEVSRLAELGDFSENAEYQMAKGRLRGINQTILNIESQLKHAEIIAPQKRADSVQFGHNVTIACDNKQKTYQILGSSETNPQKGIISRNSPIGAALIGRKVNDIIKIKLSGKEIEYKIIKIE